MEKTVYEVVITASNIAVVIGFNPIAVIGLWCLVEVVYTILLRSDVGDLVWVERFVNL